MESASPICALVAASDFNSEHFKLLDDDCVFDCVIAVDGGYAHLLSINHSPDLALGDFDSLGYVPDSVRVEEHPTKKDASDLELALDWAVREGYVHLYVYGAFGGRLDHTLANIQLMARYAEQGATVTAIGADFAARYVVGPAEYYIPPLDSGVVSVFAMTPEARGVIERGMEYPVDGEDFSNRTTRGLSNELNGSQATVGCKEGTLIVFHPLQTR